MDAAKATAARLEREAASADARIVLGYRLILGRRPQDREIELARGFLAASPLTEFCRVLFNLNGFLYVD
jgi:hypothetical protein